MKKPMDEAKPVEDLVRRKMSADAALRDLKDREHGIVAALANPRTEPATRRMLAQELLAIAADRERIEQERAKIGQALLTFDAQPRLRAITDAEIPSGQLREVRRGFDAGQGVLSAGAVLDITPLPNAEIMAGQGFFGRSVNPAALRARGRACSCGQLYLEPSSAETHWLQAHSARAVERQLAAQAQDAIDRAAHEAGVAEAKVKHPLQIALDQIAAQRRAAHIDRRHEHRGSPLPSQDEIDAAAKRRMAQQSKRGGTLPPAA